MEIVHRVKQSLLQMKVVATYKRWLRVVSASALTLLLTLNGLSGEKILVPITGPGVQTATTLTFTTDADAYVKQSYPKTNYGNAQSLQVDGDSKANFESFIRFSVSGVSGTVQNARLRVYATSNGTNNGPAIYGTNAAWTETTITWNNRPARTSGAVDNLVKIGTYAWAEYDVTSLVTGDGTFSFVLVPDSQDGVRFSSRQGTRSPELVITLRIDENTPTPTETSTPTEMPTPTETPTPEATSTSSTEETGTSTPEETATDTPTLTEEPQATSTPTFIPDIDTPTPTSTDTPTLTEEPQATSTFIPDTDTPTLTFTDTPTSSPTSTDTPSSTPTPTSSGSVVFVGAGDITSCSNNNDEATAKLLDNISGTVFAAGDNAYTDGSYTQYINCYGPTWGRHKARTRPVPGNHEYLTSGAAGYFQYFNSVPAYYAFNLGSWRIYALNSELSVTATSAQVIWLQNDLATNPSQCVLAYWHKPRWSSGSNHGSTSSMQTLWQVLYNAGAELVINGHEHNYERFAEMNASGVAASQGLREIVVGTGGASLYPFGTPLSTSQVRNNSTYGVLKLTLRADGYDWQFIPVAGSTFTDNGSSSCH